jgi:hypothetical protein
MQSSNQQLFIEVSTKMYCRFQSNFMEHNPFWEADIRAAG